jgi:hypothetical protein
MSQIPAAPASVSLSQVNTALGRSATASLSFNDASFRFLCAQESGSVSISNMRGKGYASGTVTVATFFGKEATSYGYIQSAVGSITQSQQLPGYGLGAYVYALTGTPGFNSTDLEMRNIFTTNSIRVKVGSQNSVLANWGPGTYYRFGGEPPLITAANVGQTLTWQLTQQQ